MDENQNSQNPDLIQVIVEWIANPMDQRSAKQVGLDNNCSESTIYRLRRTHADVIRARVDVLLAANLKAARPFAYKSLLNRITKSDNSLKLFFQLCGDLVERSEQKIEYKTPEEKKEKIKALLAGLSSRLETKETGDGKATHNE
jgi:hypothetical protein